MHNSRTVVLAALTACLIAGSAFATSRTATKPGESRGLEPAHLPSVARDILHARMKDHRVDVEQLMRAVLTLDHAKAADLATGIADDARLARPLPDDAASLNALLPERFFTLQEDLRDSARILAESARKKDDPKIAESFGKVMRTCVACHSVYLNESGTK